MSKSQPEVDNHSKFGPTMVNPQTSQLAVDGTNAHWTAVSQWLAAVEAGNLQASIVNEVLNSSRAVNSQEYYEPEAAQEGGFRPIKVRVTENLAAIPNSRLGRFIRAGFEAKALTEKVFNGCDVVKPWKIGDLSLVPLYELGYGSFGAVICALASSSRLPNPIEVAIKMSPLHLRRHFLREYATMAELSGRGIVPKLLAAGENEDTSFLVMEKFHASVASRLDVAARGGKNGVPVEELRPLVKETVLLLSKMHRSNHVHLDVKPWNILASMDGRLALCDVASCHRFHPNDTESNYVPRRGSEGYLAPEVRDRLPILEPSRADMYSLGMTIAWLCGVSVPPGPLTTREIAAVVALAFPIETHAIANDFLWGLLEPSNDERLSADKALSHAWLANCEITPRNTAWMRYLVPSRSRILLPHPGPIESYPKL